MSLQASDVLAPKGRIPPKLFPALDAEALQEQIDQWIAEGEVEAATIADPATNATAVGLWVQYRAFDTAYLAALNTPMTSSTQDVGSQSFSELQVQAWARLAAEALSSFGVLVDGAVAVADENALGIPPSGSSKTHTTIFDRVTP